MKTNTNKKKIVIIISAAAVITLLAAAGRFIYIQYLLSKNSSPSYCEDIVDWSGNFTDDAEPGYITMPGFDEISLKAGKDTSNVLLGNPETNECLFQYQMILDGTNEVIYSSDMLKPGKAIVTQKLNKAFSEGDYPLTIHVNTFSLDGKTAYNGTDIAATLHVIKG